MENTMELIRNVSVRVANESKLSFLKNDVNSILKDGTPFNQKETVKRLEHAFVNANYAGDLQAGELSFILSNHLRGYAHSLSY